MSLSRKLCSASLFLLLGALSACGPKVPSKEVVTEAVKKILPVDFEVVSVTPLTQLPGLVQVALSVGKQPVVFYTDGKAKYIFSGSIMELESKKNLTAEAMTSLAGGQKAAISPSAAPVPKGK